MRIDTTDTRQITELAHRIISQQLDISDILETDYNRARGAAKADTEQWRLFANSLTAEQREILSTLDEEQNRLQSIELRTAFALGKRCGHAELARRPALERFIDFLQTQRHGPEQITDYGSASFQRNVRTVLPFIPQLMLSGLWQDWTDGPVTAAIEAVKEAEHQGTLAGDAAYLADDPDTLKTEELEAHYVTGLVVGLALAEVL